MFDAHLSQPNSSARNLARLDTCAGSISNTDLISWSERAQALRHQGLPTLPTTIGQELQVNPFMRSDQAAVITAAKAMSEQEELPSPAHVLAVIRAWKDRV
jgi:hydroxyacylglutathione hydrolase